MSMAEKTVTQDYMTGKHPPLSSLMLVLDANPANPVLQETYILQLGRITFRVTAAEWRHLVNLNVLRWCASDRLVHATFAEVLNWERLDEPDEFRKPSQGA